MSLLNDGHDMRECLKGYRTSIEEASAPLEAVPGVD